MKERTFKNPVVLEEMLHLRWEGWPIKELALKYNCDHTSIRKACLRNGLPAVVYLQHRPVIIFRRVHVDFDGERINPGKSYKEYLKESKKRRQPQLRIKGVDL